MASQRASAGHRRDGEEERGGRERKQVVKPDKEQKEEGQRERRVFTTTKSLQVYVCVWRSCLCSFVCPLDNVWVCVYETTEREEETERERV